MAVKYILWRPSQAAKNCTFWHVLLHQGVDHFKKIRYAPGITYGELFLENEREMSAYNLEHADLARAQALFSGAAEEAQMMLEKGLAMPA